MKQRVILCFLGASLALYGCDNPSDPDAGPGTEDSGPGADDAGPDDAPTCASYCDNAMSNCTGADAVYADRAECEALCAGFGWAAGDPVTVSGPVEGNTIGCRQYHSGGPAGEDPATHCPHAGPTGDGVCGSLCESYCGAAMAVCTGGDALYVDMAECMGACSGLDGTADIGVTNGDSVQCRLYHLGVAVSTGDAATHCAHAGETGAGVCVGGWDFRTDEPAAAYTRVDQAGMPALSTVLAATFTQPDETARNAVKNLYNDLAPDTSSLVSVTDGIAENLTALHTVLSDDLVIDVGLTSCAAYSTDPSGTAGSSTAGVVANVDTCLAQAGPLVIPDVLSVDRSSTVTFPNGRDLTDQVIDITLAVALLDLSVTGQDPGTLAGVSLNPAANDVAFSTDFPYLAPPHAP